MTNPNKAFRNRHNPSSMQGFKYLLFMDQCDVRLICQNCGWTAEFTVLGNDRFYYTTIECEGCGDANWGWIRLGNKKEGRA